MSDGSDTDLALIRGWLDGRLYPIATDLQPDQKPNPLLSAFLVFGGRRTDPGCPPDQAPDWTLPQQRVAACLAHLEDRVLPAAQLLKLDEDSFPVMEARFVRTRDLLAKLRYDLGAGAGKRQVICDALRVCYRDIDSALTSLESIEQPTSRDRTSPAPLAPRKKSGPPSQQPAVLGILQERHKAGTMLQSVTSEAGAIRQALRKLRAADSSVRVLGENRIRRIISEEHQRLRRTVGGAR